MHYARRLIINLILYSYHDDKFFKLIIEGGFYSVGSGVSSTSLRAKPLAISCAKQKGVGRWRKFYSGSFLFLT
jgi:hypothetical protein